MIRQTEHTSRSRYVSPFIGVIRESYWNES